MRGLHFSMGLFLLFDFLTVLIEQLPTRPMPTEDHHPVGAKDFNLHSVKGIEIRIGSLTLPYGLRGFDHIGSPPSLLQHNGQRIVLISRNRGIGSLRVILKREIASCVVDRIWKALIENHAGEIKLMNGIIKEAAAKIPEAIPVFAARGVIGALGRGAQPHNPIEA